MIPRYAREEMAALWTDSARFHLWLEIERHVLDAMVSRGLAPKSAAKAFAARARFDEARIAEIEKKTRHDVLAFLTNLAETIGEEARFVHQGLTSSDILDTGFNLQLRRAADILLADLDALLSALKARALEHKRTLCVGRSHGIHAEPTSFGLKLLQAFAEFRRARDRLIMARREVSVCALSGPVGTFASVPPEVEAYVAEKMGLAVEPISSQIVPRDRHAMFFAVLGVIAASVERLAVEVRHLQRSEILEVSEPFGEGQKGSSAMPHKRNPILSENLTGLARLIRGYVSPALENVALWHERDISHSSVERVVAPDATIALDFALHRLRGIVEGMRIYPDRMLANLESSGGLIYSHGVLVSLVRAGLSREEAYGRVQSCALEALEGGGDFRVLLGEDSVVADFLSGEDLDRLFDVGGYLGHVDEIFARVLDSS